MDILFYDFKLNRLHTLPSSSESVGYVSMNCKIEFNGSGSLQLLFWDKELEGLVRTHPEGLIVKYGDFEGFTTGYQFEDVNKRLYGMHLNGLLHKQVIPIADLSGDLETVMYGIVTDNYPWLNTFQAVGGFETVAYKTDTYTQGDTFISDLAAVGHAGCSVYIDWESKRFLFKLLKSEENSLKLSENNLNAYELKENYDGKNIAFGGWYKQEQPEGSDGSKPEPIWTYVSTQEKEGLYKQDVILSAANEADALKELGECVADYRLTLKTKNIKFGVDYKLGDKLKVQRGTETIPKTVTGIEIWHEKNEYNEQPILGELKEVETSE